MPEDVLQQHVVGTLVTTCQPVPLPLEDLAES